jgi:hypothetical protein
LLKGLYVGLSSYRSNLQLHQGEHPAFQNLEISSLLLWFFFASLIRIDPIESGSETLAYMYTVGIF